MIRNAFLKVLLAAAFFVVVASKAVPFNPVYPFHPFDPFPELNPSQQPDTIHKEIVFGEDVDGATELINSSNFQLYDSERSEISSVLSYPCKNFIGGHHKITKILVVITNIDEDATSDVNIKEGGLNETHVTLEVLAKNSRKLKYNTQIFGTPAETTKD